MRFFFVFLSLVIIGLPGVALTSNSQAENGKPATGDAERQDEVDFNRDVRPLLSDRCFLCHGPDQNSEMAGETDLRLDDRESATDFEVFDFDDVKESEILLRVLSEDPGDQMPPADSGRKRLTADEVDIVRRWIEQGAEYEKHWAFQTPGRPEVPVQQEQIEPAPLADRPTLIRRVTLDLTGLPPTNEDVDAFVSDPAPLEIAFEKVVDRLLASDAYAEHMARYWLDASRYADTSGYQYDRERTQWVWRDWVIHAFNTNMPFDQFTIEQLAGDLLPDADDLTRLATGFNRNHPITIEGGVVDEEYRTEYVIDRVVTTSTVWLGQTMLCARCHDHKYDPVSQSDFYQFFAYFNNVPEKGLNGFDPKLTVASPLANERLAKLMDAEIELQNRVSALDLPLDEWEQQLSSMIPDWATIEPDQVVSVNGAEVELLEDKSVLLKGANPPTDDYEIIFDDGSDIRAIRLEAIKHESLTNGSTSRGTNGNFVLTEFIVDTGNTDSDKFAAVNIERAQADYEQNGYDVAQAIDGKRDGKQGWAVDGNTRNENRTAIFDLAEPVAAGTTVRIRMFQRWGSSHQIGRFRLSVSERPSISPETVNLLNLDANERTEVQQNKLTTLLIRQFGSQVQKQLVAELEFATRKRNEAETFPATMVMQEMAEPRQAYVLERGEYDKPLQDQPVAPGVPVALGEVGADAPANRLGLAQWLVAREQPLTARVTVNRFWQQLFGTGLVKTSEDFGFQGEYPSHPELLDWLAVEFMESGWDVKELLKLIVMSRTWQQSSRVTPEMLERDLDNRLLARGPSSRLDGEVIRDCALAVSGLLDRTVGGPSVYPYHPDGLWLEINNRPNFSRPYPHPTDTSQLYRRSMYSFWKRTVTPPSAGAVTV